MPLTPSNTVKLYIFYSFISDLNCLRPINQLLTELIRVKTWRSFTICVCVSLCVHALCACDYAYACLLYATAFGR